MQATQPTLICPARDVSDPELSIVVPALNEELTVGEFVRWCQEGLLRANICGEIIIVDSSTDRTAEIALSEGARVVATPRRGLGHAYRDAIPFIRGRFVIMGDADCTYDFRELKPFIEQLRAGVEFVMGSRFRGDIEPGAMPLHHRYLGTPITTALLNLLFSTKFSDIHCGMRGVTRESLIRMDLRADGWEYASEMILKSIHLNLRTSEVPINFYKDRFGRVSNVKRAGRLTSWKAGWDTLRMLFINGADFFLFIPGMILAILGLLGVAVVSTGPLSIGSITLTLHSEMLFTTIAIVGVLSTFLGIIAKSIYDPTGQTSAKWSERFKFNRTAVITGCLALAGLTLDLVFLVIYVDNDFRVTDRMTTVSHLAILGLFLIVASFTVMASTFVVHAIAATRPLLSSDGQVASDLESTG